MLLKSLQSCHREEYRLPCALCRRCTFCEGCFANLVKFGGRCTTCSRSLPRDAKQFVVNLEMKAAIEAFQQQGGEDAQYETMMTELKTTPSQQQKPRYKVRRVQAIVIW